MATLSHQEAKGFYDRFGAWQDAQGWYEDRATSDLVAHSDLPSARSVFEFGCGTGRFAERILRAHLQAECAYLGADISETMVELATERLAPWTARARVEMSTGDMQVNAREHEFDRVISNYVRDLLSEQDVTALLAEARRILAPGGRLCLTGLGLGTTPLSRLVANL
jgi:ubiquinone/menaquinone biosynthesis C-methylase UbiE